MVRPIRLAGGVANRSFVGDRVDGDPPGDSRAKRFETIGEMMDDELGRSVVGHEDLVRTTDEFGDIFPVMEPCFVLSIPQNAMQSDFHACFVLHQLFAFLKSLFCVCEAAEK